MITDIIVLVIIVIAGLVSIYLEKLTILACITGCILAIVIYFGFGIISLTLLALFFFLGTFTGSIGHKKKKKINNQFRNSSMRNTEQVLANGGVAGLLSVLSFVVPEYSLLLFYMLAASLSSSTADTLSSELGVLYGKKTYDILSLKKGEKGTDGVVSIEGTMFGLLGSMLIAFISTYRDGFTYFHWILIAGLLGNLADSYLGATLERRKIIGNNTVNFLSNLFAALIILPLYYYK